MGRKKIDLTGQRFGKLTVIERAPKPENRKNIQSYWKCQCDCGNIVIIDGSSLKNGHTVSCGCYQKQKLTKHGLSQSPLYHVWTNFRVYAKNKAIIVCKEWSHDFTEFYDWAMSHNYKKGMALKRIDPKGAYCPENCTWISFTEQPYNKRNSRHLTIHEETHCIREWARIRELPLQTYYARKRHGWSDKDAMLKPVRKSQKIDL